VDATCCRPLGAGAATAERTSASPAPCFAVCLCEHKVVLVDLRRFGPGRVQVGWVGVGLGGVGRVWVWVGWGGCGFGWGGVGCFGLLVRWCGFGCCYECVPHADFR
jgi:hypothetical protein